MTEKIEKPDTSSQTNKILKASAGQDKEKQKDKSPSPAGETNKIEFKAPISSVTVLTCKSVVTRTGTIQLKAGMNEVLVTGVPPRMVENSVRVSGKGQAGTKIVEVNTKKEHSIETQEEKAKAAEEELKKAEWDRKALCDEIESLTAQIEFLTKTAAEFSREFPKGFGFKKSELSDLDAFNKFLGVQLPDVKKKKLEKEKALFELDQRIQKLKADYTKFSSKTTKTSYSISIVLEAQKEGDFELSVSYLMTGVSWIPLYDVRLSTEDSKVDFTYYGIVRQNTGEDWKDVSVILSTASESPTKELPEISPWYIYGYKESRSVFFKAAKVRYEERAKAMPMGAPQPCAAPPPAPPEGGVGGFEEEQKPKVDAEAFESTVETKGDTVVYRIEKKADIPSDNEPHKLTIGKITLDATLEYLSVPKNIPEVYTRVEVKNTSEYMFLPGAMNLFSDDEFMGESSLGLVAPTEKFAFSGGITKSVKIKRELLKSEYDKGGLFGGLKRRTYKYRIRVENNKKNTIKIKVKDSLPYPQHEDIKIIDEIYSENDKPTKKYDNNIIEWVFELEPGKKKTIEFGFAIQYPSKMSIEGELN